MRKNINLSKIANTSLALLITASHIATAMEENSKGEIPPALSNTNNYNKILQEIEALTARIHAEVDKVLTDYKRDTQEYHRRMGFKRDAATTASLTETPKEFAQNPEGKAVREPLSLDALVKAEQKRQNAAKEEAETAANEEYAKNSEDTGILAKDLGLKTQATAEEIKNALYLKQILNGQNPTNFQIAVMRLFMAFSLGRPTEAQFFAMMHLPDYQPWWTAKEEMTSLAQRYDEAKAQLLQQLGTDEKLTQDQIGDRIRQQDKLSDTADLSLAQINEEVRLKAMGIENPTEQQIKIGVSVKQGENEDEVNQLVEEVTQLTRKIEEWTLLVGNNHPNQNQKSQLVSLIKTTLGIPDLTPEEFFKAGRWLAANSRWVINRVAEKYHIKDLIKEFVRVMRLLRGNLPKGDQITEGLRQNKARNNSATLEQINEGVRLNYHMRRTGGGETEATIEQIDEALRLQTIGIKFPSLEQINEALRH